MNTQKKFLKVLSMLTIILLIATIFIPGNGNRNAVASIGILGILLLFLSTLLPKIHKLTLNLLKNQGKTSPWSSLESSEPVSETEELLWRQISYQITAKLQAAFPNATWEFQKPPSMKQLLCGNPIRLRTFHTEDYNFAEEESTVPILEDWYVIPKEIQRICEHAKLTTDSKQPMRNFMLRGPAGTGKTEGAKAIAAGLHLPYRCITCSANTEIFDLLGQILPDVDEKQLSLVGELPSFQDITLDPATAYEKLTGTYDEKVSENTVYEELIHHISEAMKQKQTATSSSQQFRYVDTPLVEAIRNGYLVEIQEPTVIANPGVLVGLNSLLDRCNSVFLPNGEVIHRHPDTTIVVTTNHDYAGCRPMNQSVISRMNMVIDMDEPDEETMVERVLAITGCSDKKSVRTMTQIVRSIAQYCQDNLITDGCCGVRELIAWVQSFMVCGDIQEAAHYTILSSVTADSESRIEIEGSCLDTVLAS